MKSVLDDRTTGKELAIGSSLLLALAVLPHATHIHLPVIGIFYATVLLKIIAILVYPGLANRWVVIGLAIVGFTISSWHYGAPLGRDPGVSFLVTLSGLKILEAKTRRDARIVLTLGYFIVVTHFLYFAGFWTVLYLFAVVFAITWQMLQLGHVSPRGKARLDGWLTLKIAAQAIPFALVLFFLFPRFAGSLWLLQMPENRGVTGMSESLTMGTITNLVGSRAIAFTASFGDSVPPPPAARYWRASVLWDYDGRTWIRGDEMAKAPSSLSLAGTNARYEIEPASSNDQFLYALDIPITAPSVDSISGDLILTRSQPNRPMVRYEVISNIVYRNFTTSQEQADRGSQLPSGAVSPRMADLVQQLRQPGSGNDSFAANFIQYIQDNEFVYTLQPPALLGRNPVDEFLFDSRRGFCEHYASSFVALMRAAGIPSRLVVGYLGGELNPRANLITVRQEDAHAWAEYWSDEQGWVRVDPTAAIAPERIEFGINFDLSLGDEGRVRYQTADLGLVGNMLREAQWYSQLAKREWNRWFVGFDYNRQQILLRGLGIRKFGVEKITAGAFIAAFALLLIIFWLIFRSTNIKKDRAVKLYDDFCRKLAARGLVREDHEGPLDFYHRCAENLADSSKELLDITQLYLSIRYGTGGSADDLDRLNKQIRALEV